MVINHRQSSYRLQQGVMIIEALVVICVLVSLMSLGAKSITKNAERTVNQVTAQQLQQITQAAQYYIQDHYLAFKNDPNLKLDWQQLVDDGYLSNHQLSKNHYGQAYDFTITQQQGLLQLLLTTQGGNPINEQSLRQIAALAGSSAGYVSGLDPGKIIGNQQSWVLAGTSLPPGHLASLTLVNEQEVMDAATFLRRTQIAGHPEYNQMETDFWMMANTIQMKQNSTLATLNKDALIFSQSKLKGISIFNSQYPNIIIQDGSLPLPNTMKINSADLKFTKGYHNIHIGVDDPKMLIEKKLDGWSTDIKPAEIRLNSREGVHPAIFLQGSQSSVVLNQEGLSINNKAVATADFVTARMHQVGNVDDKWQLQAVADKLNCNNNEGRLFSVGDNSSNFKKKLLMCIWRPNTGRLSYMVVKEGIP